MENKEHAKRIVRKLYERPEAKDADGEYDMVGDISQMEGIVREYLDMNGYFEKDESEPKSWKDNLFTELHVSDALNDVHVSKMKYEKEIDEFLREMVYEDWMSEEEYQLVVEITNEIMGIDKQKISDDIEKGVAMGISAEAQFNLLRKLLK